MKIHFKIWAVGTFEQPCQPEMGISFINRYCSENSLARLEWDSFCLLVMKSNSRFNVSLASAVPLWKKCWRSFWSIRWASISSWQMNLLKFEKNFFTVWKLEPFSWDLNNEHLNNRNIWITSFYLSRIQILNIKRVVWILDWI